MEEKNPYIAELDRRYADRDLPPELLAELALCWELRQMTLRLVNIIAAS